VLTLPSVARIVRLTLTTIEAWVGLCVFDIARLRGFPVLHRNVRAWPIRARRSALSAADVIWAVDEACVWYLKRSACLQRSTVATRLLRRHGIAAELVIGYRPIPFESHAWIEVDGRIVNDLPQYQARFTVLDRL
jgi:hypothetical protein